MKFLVVCLMLLAAAKLGTQEYMYREATSDVIVSAYRQRAIEACRIDSRGQGLAIQESVWAQPSSLRLAIGKPAVDVQLWQVDNPFWNARWRNPYLFLSPAGNRIGLVCEYDIVNATAQIQKL